MMKACIVSVALLACVVSGSQQMHEDSWDEERNGVEVLTDDVSMSTAAVHNHITRWVQDQQKMFREHAAEQLQVAKAVVLLGTMGSENPMSSKELSLIHRKFLKNAPRLYEKAMSLHEMTDDDIHMLLQVPTPNAGEDYREWKWVQQQWFGKIGAAIGGAASGLAKRAGGVITAAASHIPGLTQAVTAVTSWAKKNVPPLLVAGIKMLLDQLSKNVDHFCAIAVAWLKTAAIPYVPPLAAVPTNMLTGLLCPLLKKLICAAKPLIERQVKGKFTGAIKDIMESFFKSIARNVCSAQSSNKSPRATSTMKVLAAKMMKARRL